jgi:hypothetical protein
MKSKRETDEPIWRNPYTDSALPMRANFLRLQELAKLTKSRTLCCDPSLTIPQTENELPRRMYERRDNALPKLKASNMLTPLARRVKP